MFKILVAREFRSSTQNVFGVVVIPVCALAICIAVAVQCLASVSLYLVALEPFITLTFCGAAPSNVTQRARQLKQGRFLASLIPVAVFAPCKPDRLPLMLLRSIHHSSFVLRIAPAAPQILGQEAKAITQALFMRAKVVVSGPAE